MGKYGGWSVKPQLGLSNATLGVFFGANIKSNHSSHKGGTTTINTYFLHLFKGIFQILLEMVVAFLSLYCILYVYILYIIFYFKYIYP